MKKTVIRLILIAAATGFLASCAARNQTQMVDEGMVRDLTPLLAAKAYVPKVDGMVVLLDASSSMDERVQGYKKIDVAKAFVSRMNQTLPPIQAISGLRTFGHDNSVSQKSTRLFFGMAPYNRDGVDEGLAHVSKAGGPTPMEAAIKGAAKDLEQVKGRKVVILISDGEDQGENPLLAAREMQEKFKDQLCIHTVFVGNSKAGESLMKEIADVSPCGTMSVALKTLPGAAMADYVTNVFLTENEKTAAVTKEKMSGQMATADSKKKDTGLGYHKPEPVIPKLDTVYFQFDKADLTPESRSLLDQTIEILKAHPDMAVMIKGYTSEKGTDAYNMKLSERRAAAVKQYLVEKGKISPDRIPAKGYGEKYPAVPESNPEKIASAAARANMRVEFDVQPN